MQIWALTVSEDERTIISGAADSKVVFWDDVTEQEERERVEQAAELVLKFVSLLQLSPWNSC
jgi:U3 small nucleolar RNA-associated protein 13